jgi:hypothetical protein
MGVKEDRGSEKPVHSACQGETTTYIYNYIK